MNSLVVINGEIGVDGHYANEGAEAKQPGGERVISRSRRAMTSSRGPRHPFALSSSFSPPNASEKKKTMEETGRGPAGKVHREKKRALLCTRVKARKFGRWTYKAVRDGETLKIKTFALVVTE